MKSRAFNIRTRSDKKSRSIHISIEGETGINQVESIRKKLDFPVSETNEITIELRNIVSFDLSTFQLLFSMKKLMDKSGFIVSVKTSLPQEDLIILKNCGLENYIKNWNQN